MSPFLSTLGAGSVRGFGRGLRSLGVSVTPPGQQAYTTGGSYSFVVPAGITSISVLCVGGGAGGTAGGNGGSTSYDNNIAVTPGETLSVQVSSAAGPSQSGGTSNLRRGATVLVQALGGVQGGSQIGFWSEGGQGFQGGGGAAGYNDGVNFTRTGGDGGSGGSNGASGVASYGGGGGGGGGGGVDSFPSPYYGLRAYIGNAGGAGGGGVGLLGVGSTGAGGDARYLNQSPNGGVGGGAGSNGNVGFNGDNAGQGEAGPSGGTGGAYGGGGGKGEVTYTYEFDGSDWVLLGSNSGTAGNGNGGAVRIIWGPGRSYPSNAGNV